MPGKLKGLLRERARAGENPYQTPNSWVSLSLSTLPVLFARCVCVFFLVSAPVPSPPPRPGSDAVLLYGKVSWGTPPIFPGGPGTIPVLCPRAGHGTKAGPVSWMGSSLGFWGIHPHLSVKAEMVWGHQKFPMGVLWSFFVLQAHLPIRDTLSPLIPLLPMGAVNGGHLRGGGLWCPTNVALPLKPY